MQILNLKFDSRLNTEHFQLNNKKDNQKWAKHLNRYLYRHTDSQYAHKKMFKIIRYLRVRNKNTMRYYFTPISEAILGEPVKSFKPSFIADGNVVLTMPFISYILML